MTCKTCKSENAWWIKMYQGEMERCSECSSERGPSSQGLATPAWSAQKERLGQKVTKQLTNRHVYVPPLTEGHTGGVFTKNQ